MTKKKLYKVNLGIDGFVLESHIVEATNKTVARDIAISKFLHPDKGFNYISVERISGAN